MGASVLAAQSGQFGLHGKSSRRVSACVAFGNSLSSVGMAVLHSVCHALQGVATLKGFAKGLGKPLRGRVRATTTYWSLPRCGPRAPDTSGECSADAKPHVLSKEVDLVPLLGRAFRCAAVCWRDGTGHSIAALGVLCK